MFGLGFSEIVLLGVLALIVIGPKQLPEVARTLGRFLNEMKRATDDFKGEFARQARADLDFKTIRRPDDEHSNANQEKTNQENETVISAQDEYQKHIGGGHHQSSNGAGEEQLTMNLEEDGNSSPKKENSST